MLCNHTKKLLHKLISLNLTFNSTDQQPAVTTGCDHCPPGIPCDPFSGACMQGKTKLDCIFLNLVTEF